MQEFQVCFRSVQDVQDFVSIVTSCPYPVTLRDAKNKANGKSFMELFCLDFSRPLRLEAACGDPEGQALSQNIHQFLVK